MKYSVEKFMQEEPSSAGRRSRLAPFKNEILLLKDKGYTLDQILKFLSYNDVAVSKTELHRFIKSRSGIKPQKPTLPPTPTEEQVPVVQKPSPQSQRQSEQPKPSGNDTFDWQTPVNLKDLI